MLCSDILRFADPRLENKVRVNGINLTKFVRISEEFELSEFELSGVNYYRKTAVSDPTGIGFSSS